MKVFHKSLSEYFEFQRVIMILILAVGFARLLLSLAGVTDSIAKWFSLTAFATIGIIYCAVQVPRRGFGGYKHLLPLYRDAGGHGKFDYRGRDRDLGDQWKRKYFQPPGIQWPIGK